MRLHHEIRRRLILARRNVNPQAFEVNSTDAPSPLPQAVPFRGCRQAFDSHRWRNVIPAVIAESYMASHDVQRHHTVDADLADVNGAVKALLEIGDKNAAAKRRQGVECEMAKKRQDRQGAESHSEAFDEG